MIPPGRRNGRIMVFSVFFILLAAALYGRGTREDSVLPLTGILIEEMEELISLLNGFIETRTSFGMRLAILQEDDPNFGGRSFLSFASWLIAGLDLACSNELIRSAQANIDSMDAARYEVGQTQMEEGIRLNPNNTQAQSLLDPENRKSTLLMELKRRIDEIL
jgi:hypothetical protein